MFSGKFITLAEFAFLEPINVFHREGAEGDVRRHPDGLRNLHILFRGRFMKSSGGRILMRFSADDYCRVFVNGRFAAQGPAQGYYFDYNFCETDITPFICEGENEITAEVYYQGLINRAYDSGDLRCGFICDIEADGKPVFSTDESWLCCVDKSYIGYRTTGYDTQFLEDRDMRLKPSEWERVRVREHDYTFADKPFPAVDVFFVEPVGTVTRPIKSEPDDNKANLSDESAKPENSGNEEVSRVASDSAGRIGSAEDICNIRAADVCPATADRSPDFDACAEGGSGDIVSEPGESASKPDGVSESEPVSMTTESREAVCHDEMNAETPGKEKEERNGRVSRLFDFGAETVGTFDIVVRGHSGDELLLRAAEELLNGEEGLLSPDTEIRYMTRANCGYDERIILDEGENRISGFDYKAFRYAELICPENVELVSFGAMARNHPFDEAACVLDTSDTVLMKVFDICKRGVKLCSQETYVDCPGREKGQYAGDLTITSASQLWLTGNTELFCKAVRNQRESAFIDEGLMAVTPGSFMQEIADYSLQFPIIALRYYYFTGDREGLMKLLPVCDRLLTSFERFQREDGLLEGVDKWNLVDWPANLRDDYDFELTKPIGKGVHNVVNAFYIGAVICTERMIDLLGIDLENGVENGARRSDALIEAFNRAFFREDKMLYADSETSSHTSLHSNVLPLYFGFARREAYPRMAELIRQRKFSGGVYISYFAMKAMARLGLYADIWEMITSTGENSWYNMVREGGTTCFEAWGKDKKWNTSLCHAWASAPISVLIEDLVGISPREPGFKDINIHPHLPKTLERFDMRIPLPDGRHIEFEWEKGFYNWRLLK